MEFVFFYYTFIMEINIQKLLIKRYFFKLMSGKIIINLCNIK
jgi:hypothetical protein